MRAQETRQTAPSQEASAQTAAVGQATFSCSSCCPVGCYGDSRPYCHGAAVCGRPDLQPLPQVNTPLRSELQQAGGDVRPSLIGGGRRKKGKRRARGPRRPRKANEGSPGFQDIEHIMIERNMKLIKLRSPKGPFPGALMTTRQLVSTFNSETGLSNLGGSGSAGQLIANSTVAVTGFGFCVALEFQDLAQATSWSAVFDQYRIEKALFRFKSRNNAISVQNTASPNSGVPTGYVVVDRDDATVLTVGQAQEYDNCQTFSGEEDFVVSLVPSVTPAVFSSGAFTGYGVAPSGQMWLDVASNNVPHYGVKGWISGLTVSTTSIWVWDITCEVVISFKNTR